MSTERRHFLRGAGKTLAAACVLAHSPWGWAQATPSPEVRAALPQARLQGAGRMRFFGLNIYDARLWAGADFRADQYAQHALGLELSYLRTLTGKDIAERSLKEMRRAGNITPEQAQAWLSAMQEAFPDVRSGDRITGAHDPKKGATFWFNGQVRATVADPEFSRLFFGIWLATTTSEPSLRAQLLAGSDA